MVGYAYSLDFTLGYRYILIKCYDCDDIDFADDTMPYAVYRVERQSGKVETVLNKFADSGKRLPLKHIKEITELLIISEFDFDYPVVMSWAVNPSGICNKKHAEDLGISWPVPLALADSEASYINVTSVCFRSSPSLLDATFTVSVLNEAIYHCGIYQSSPFCVCGNEIFCSRYLAVVARKLCGVDVLNENLADISGEKAPKCTFSKDKILSSLKSLDFCHGDYLSGEAEVIVNIKRECIEKVLKTIKDFLEESCNFGRFLKLMKLHISRALRDIKTMSAPFLARSGAERSIDMNYLTFDQLMMVFAFPVSHTDTRKIIRINRSRKRRLKTLDVPAVIYKGRFYK